MSRPAFALRVGVLNDARVPVYTDRAAAEAWRGRYAGGEGFRQLLASADACAFRFVSDDHVHRWGLYIPPGAPPTRVSHECLHMAWYLLDSHGVAVDVHNHEVLAYLQEHLADQILAKLPATA